MPVEATRTDAVLATLRLYDRCVHPELFDTRKSVEYSFPGGFFRAQVTAAGHVLVLRHREVYVTEVVGYFEDDAIPDMGIAVTTKAKSGRDVQWSCDGLGYMASCQLDVVDREVFEQLDREMTLDSREADLYCRLGSGGRLDPSALSVVRLEPLDGAISVHTSHTYPGENTILRTQSLFDLTP